MLGLVLAVAVTVLVVLALWRVIRDHRRFEALKHEEAAREEEVRELKADAERREADERRLHERLETERQWTAELQNQVARMHKERGILSDQDDVRSLVLHTAIMLLEAE